MLVALGARLLDADGRPLAGTGADLDALRSVDLSGLADLDGVEIVCATDVDSPLAGPDGAAHVFGAQKGADAAQRRRLDDGLRHLVEVLDGPTGGAATRAARTRGAGAAGGLGMACALLGASMRSGADLVLDLVGFDAAVEGCDLVVTGEGRLDEQTLAGKLPAVVARRAAPRPVVAVVGRSALPVEAAEAVFDGVHELAARTTADCSRDAGLSERLLAAVGRELGRRVPAPAS